MNTTYSTYNNKIVKNKNFKIDVFNASLFYGINVFEVIYFKFDSKKNNFYAFRLKDHFERLLKSSKNLNIKHNLTYSKLTDNIKKLITKN